MNAKLVFTISLIFLFAGRAFAECDDEQVEMTVGGKFEVKLSEYEKKPYELNLGGKTVHRGWYHYFKIENSYQDGLSSYIVAYGFEAMGASRCEKRIMLFDIGKYGYDEHDIDHHGGMRCWDGPVSSTYDNGVLTIKAGDETYIFSGDKSGNMTLKKVLK